MAKTNAGTPPNTKFKLLPFHYLPSKILRFHFPSIQRSRRHTLKSKRLARRCSGLRRPNRFHEHSNRIITHQETASSTVNAGSFSDLVNLANVSLYGFEDYHGVDIGVVRAVRLWFAPVGGEVGVEIKIKDEDTKLGFAISHTLL